MHYKNGREAKVGDPVVGTCFNTPHKVAGTLVSLTPGTDACSAMVGFVEVVEVEAVQSYDVTCKVQGTEQHGSGGPRMASVYRQDYTECKHLLHAEDALGSSGS